MSDIINVAKITSYLYTSGGRERTGAEITDSVTNQYAVASVNLTKVCRVQGYDTATAADLGETITMLYTVTNTSVATITYNSVTIEDVILTKAGIELQNREVNGTHNGNIITVELPQGGLANGASVTYEIDIKVISSSAPQDILRTTAVATFATQTGTMNFDDSTCKMLYQHAELTLKKTNNPQHVVTTEQRIQYTVVITNNGNIQAVIPAGAYQDPIPAGTVFVSIDAGGAVLELRSNVITNRDAITVDAFGETGSVVTYQYTVQVQVQ